MGVGVPVTTFDGVGVLVATGVFVGVGRSHVPNLHVKPTQQAPIAPLHV